MKPAAKPMTGWIARRHGGSLLAVLVALAATAFPTTAGASPAELRLVQPESTPALAEPIAPSSVTVTGVSEASAMIYSDESPFLQPLPPCKPTTIEVRGLEAQAAKLKQVPPALLRLATRFRDELRQAAEREKPLPGDAASVPEDAAAPIEPNAPHAEVIVPEEVAAGTPRSTRYFVSPAMHTLGTSIGLPGGELPDNIAVDRTAAMTPTIDPRLDGRWADSGFNWAATGLCHRPLLFEEINLERYGYTHSPALQPFISGGVFLFNVAAMPYKIALHPYKHCEYTLGHYRPGSRAPWRWHRTPLRLKALTAESLVVLGLIFALP